MLQIVVKSLEQPVRAQIETPVKITLRENYFNDFYLMFIKLKVKNVILSNMGG